MTSLPLTSDDAAATSATTSTGVSTLSNDISYGRRITSKQSKSFNEGNKARHRYTDDVTVVIREKFDKSKEHVNVDLDNFTQQILDTLEKTKDSNPDWRETLENLLLIADQCTRMSTNEFWLKCESIVQELDYRRQLLPIGTLKRAHTQLLFILTRCTRLVQVLKEEKHHNEEFCFLNTDWFR